MSEWTPSAELLETANVTWLMRRVGLQSYDALHRWSVENREAFWSLAIERLEIRFRRPYERMLDLSTGIENPQWLSGATFNIVESCFSAPPDSPAIVHQAEGGRLGVMSVRQLETLTDRVAASLVRRGFKPGDAIAVVLPMTAESVAIYFGIVKAGCVVVGIADSFRPKEIAARLRIANAVGVFTQDVSLRGGKTLPLYATVIDADAPPAIVLPAGDELRLPLRAGDQAWADFLGDGPFDAIERQPADPLNILFSSGTTGEPKAIPWTQTTPIKCGVDAHFHQDVRPGDVVVWPTSLGWMMGPWLIFAALLNKATIGLYYGAPSGREFGQFVQDAKATVLGVVPTLVQSWRRSDCMADLDWTAIKLFSSTGECSRADDMAWLMAFAGGKPVIEYCGGTEIGGGYITGTIAKPCTPGTFNTPALGLDFVILDDDGRPTNNGELFLIPPSIGLSTSLLNKNHHDVYYADVPPVGQAFQPASPGSSATPPPGTGKLESLPHEILRRHGDRMEKLPDGTWRALGRADDTMNLGGIKVSSAEIEQAVRSVAGVVEVAAIAVSPGGGPSQLVVFAVVTDNAAAKSELLAAMQNAIRRDLNPLFRIQDVVIVASLPRTASNKVMRRTLRDRYGQSP